MAQNAAPQADAGDGGESQPLAKPVECQDAPQHPANAGSGVRNGQRVSYWNRTHRSFPEISALSAEGGAESGARTLTNQRRSGSGFPSPTPAAMPPNNCRGARHITTATKIGPPLPWRFPMWYIPGPPV